MFSVENETKLNEKMRCAKCKTNYSNNDETIHYLSRDLSICMKCFSEFRKEIFIELNSSHYSSLSFHDSVKYELKLNNEIINKLINENKIVESNSSDIEINSSYCLQNEQIISGYIFIYGLILF